MQPCEQSDPSCQPMTTILPFNTQPAQILGGSAANDHMGAAVSVSNGWLAVGAYGVGMNTGLVKIYKSSASTWNFFSDILSPLVPFGTFGISVSISDEFLAIGAPTYNMAQGGACVYRFDGTQWTLDTTFDNSGGAANDRVGYAVGVSRSSIVLGADGTNRFRGLATVYARQAGAGWPAQQPALAAIAPTDNDRFGFATAISGDTVLVGAPGGAGAFNTEGSAYVFVRSGTTWTVTSEPAPSSGAEPTEHFGTAVALQGDLAVIGAVGFNGGRGAVYLLSVSGGQSIQPERLAISNAAAMDSLGTAVSISGDTILAGAPNRAAARGSVYVFVRSGGVWSQQSELVPPDGEPGDGFGSSVAMVGNTAFIGAPGKSEARGALYIYNRPSAQ